MEEDILPSPYRDAIEWSYDLSPAYAELFDDVLDFARQARQTRKTRDR